MSESSGEGVWMEARRKKGRGHANLGNKKPRKSAVFKCHSPDRTPLAAR
jgi:hypothetical protein